MFLFFQKGKTQYALRRDDWGELMLVQVKPKEDKQEVCETTCLDQKEYNDE